MDGRVGVRFPVKCYMPKIFLDLMVSNVLIKAFALDEADVVIFYSDEIHSFVFFIGICAAVEDDMPFCL